MDNTLDKVKSWPGICKVEGEQRYWLQSLGNNYGYGYKCS